MVMQAFTDTELDGMKATQESAMMDECFIKPYSRTMDAGEPVETWTANPSSTKCGVDTRKSIERRGGDMTVLKSDARIRLPLGTAIGAKDKIDVITRFGQSIDTVEYALAGDPEIGPSGIVIDLMIIQPGTNR